MGIKETTFKVSGVYGRFRAIGIIVVGVILIIVGIVLAIISSSINPLILSLFGALSIIYGWILWKRCKSLIQGKFM